MKTLDSERTREILRKVRQIEIRTRRLVTDSLTGAYHSSFKGQGMDFDEVREYSPGDDVRSIDWNVTARIGTPFIKKFREERELTILLAVDLSASGNFSSNDQTIRELAAEIASVLAFSATRNDDKVGVLLFTDKVEKFIRPEKGRHHILRLIREVLFYEPEGKGTDTPGALQYLNQIQRRKAIIFLLSDFLPGKQEREGELFHMLGLTNRRHDLSCIILADPREIELPDIGWITLEDAESGEQVKVNTGNPKFRKAFAEANRKRVEDLEGELRQRGIDYVHATTDTPYMHALRTYFNLRNRRR
ncbi:MAG: DUF58 domain-containing protein [Opitutae bacterium]|nr:DUF58 domain-containing protein [Opitutae bacterium]MBT4223258.1 DUF58 domain-containing protein [Opitutae bacterium]MBT5381102.1 DUF58 domain-containing protein [Opitutae bacterium]MBT5693100.1 DUF58 domain-containing protein [Opitutae bacterium]MBT6461132.1 DUF58 domain-containing protein [Opitutae bacterium]